jgi:hypothetical protein
MYSKGDAIVHQNVYYSMKECYCTRGAALECSDTAASPTVGIHPTSSASKPTVICADAVREIVAVGRSLVMEGTRVMEEVRVMDTAKVRVAVEGARVMPDGVRDHEHVL